MFKFLPARIFLNACKPYRTLIEWNKMPPLERLCCANIMKLSFLRRPASSSFPRRRESRNPCLIEALDSRLRGNDRKKTSPFGKGDRGGFKI